MRSIPPRPCLLEAPVRDTTDRSPAELAAEAFRALVCTLAPNPVL
jgi:hypothetical protein